MSLDSTPPPQSQSQPPSSSHQPQPSQNLIHLLPQLQIQNLNLITNLNPCLAFIDLDNYSSNLRALQSSFNTVVDVNSNGTAKVKIQHGIAHGLTNIPSLTKITHSIIPNITVQTQTQLNDVLNLGVYSPENVVAKCRVMSTNFIERCLISGVRFFVYTTEGLSRVDDAVERLGLAKCGGGVGLWVYSHDDKDEDDSSKVYGHLTLQDNAAEITGLLNKYKWLDSLSYNNNNPNSSAGTSSSIIIAGRSLNGLNALINFIKLYNDKSSNSNAITGLDMDYDANDYEYGGYGDDDDNQYELTLSDTLMNLFKNQNTVRAITVTQTSANVLNGCVDYISSIDYVNADDTVVVDANFTTNDETNVHVWDSYGELLPSSSLSSSPSVTNTNTSTTNKYKILNPEYTKITTILTSRALTARDYISFTPFALNNTTTNPNNSHASRNFDLLKRVQSICFNSSSGDERGVNVYGYESVFMGGGCDVGILYDGSVSVSGGFGSEGNDDKSSSPQPTPSPSPSLEETDTETKNVMVLDFDDSWMDDTSGNVSSFGEFKDEDCLADEVERRRIFVGN